MIIETGIICKRSIVIGTYLQFTNTDIIIDSSIVKNNKVNDKIY